METLIEETEILKKLPKQNVSLKIEDLPFELNDDIPLEYRWRFFRDNREDRN